MIGDLSSCMLICQDGYLIAVTDARSGTFVYLQHLRKILWFILPQTIVTVSRRERTIGHEQQSNRNSTHNSRQHASTGIDCLIYSVSLMRLGSIYGIVFRLFPTVLHIRFAFPRPILSSSHFLVQSTMMRFEPGSNGRYANVLIIWSYAKISWFVKWMRQCCVFLTNTKIIDQVKADIPNEYLKVYYSQRICGIYFSLGFSFYHSFDLLSNKLSLVNISTDTEVSLPNLVKKDGFKINCS